MADEREVLRGAYRDFNARKIDAVLAVMTPDVEWPNGMEGGYVHGHEGVRNYWARQWTMLDPHVDPVEILRREDGRYTVVVHQMVRGRDGHLLADRLVRHVYRMRNGLIERMDIE